MPLASTSKIRIMEYKDQKYTYLGGLIHGISTLATGMKTSIKVYFRKKVTEQYPENRKELKMTGSVVHWQCPTMRITNTAV